MDITKGTRYASGPDWVENLLKFLALGLSVRAHTHTGRFHRIALHIGWVLIGRWGRALILMRCKIYGAFFGSSALDVPVVKAGSDDGGAGRPSVKGCIG